MLREALARDVTLVTTVALVGAIGIFAVVQQRGPDAQLRHALDAPGDGVEPVSDTVAALIAQGRETYAELRCAACHSIAGQGSPRYPLDGVGNRLTREEIRLWIEDPQSIRPGVRKPAFDDLEAEALEGLITYMEHLRSGPR